MNDIGPNAERWLDDVRRGNRWTHEGVAMLRRKITHYGLEWVIANEPKMRRFAEVADRSAQAMHAFEFDEKTIEVGRRRWVESWRPSKSS